MIVMEPAGNYPDYMGEFGIVENRASFKSIDDTGLQANELLMFNFSGFCLGSVIPNSNSIFTLDLANGTAGH